MDTLKEMKRLLESAMIDAERCFTKGTFARGREARKTLSEISKLCKQAREELLQKMKEEKEE